MNQIFTAKELKEFNLIYHCRETGVAYRAKKTSESSYTLLDPLTKERIKIGSSQIRKKFKADKGNSKGHHKPPCYKNYSGSRAFQEYLKGAV